MKPGAPLAADTPLSRPIGLSLGVTNTRMNATKRGIAVELALRLAVAENTLVCLVGADPTDRDVERQVPRLIASAEGHVRTQIERGLHTLDIVFMPRHHLCTVMVSDRVAVGAVLPEIRSMFDYVVVDGPSRVGGGVGIGRVLLDHLDALLVATGPSAGELALARGYVTGLRQMAGAKHVVVRVVPCGHPEDSGLAQDQLQRRLRTLPTISWLPQLWGNRGTTSNADDLDAAFRPIVEWTIDQRRLRLADSKLPAVGVTRRSNRHIANVHYREHNGLGHRH